mmetsp:Transcript_33265/g.87523  ORF Transcript_33265/g.87523 Transcript_33265/m.87523 type:complete len:415 (+) Transcript_33265:43-1287(+)
MRAATKSTRYISEATRAARRAAQRTVLAPTLDERNWGASRVRRVGVPGGIQLNTRRTASFVFKWHGTAFKSALTSWAALVHVALYVAAWQFAEYLHHTTVAESDIQDRTISVYQVNEEVTAAFAFVTSFVMAEYINFVISRYDERLSVCIDTAEASLQVALEVAVMLKGHKAEARRLVRYVMLVIHVYYLSIDGPMTPAKWELCQERGLVLNHERADLEQLEEVPAAITVSALEIVHEFNRKGILSDDHAVRMETEISQARRLASRQQDYHESPIPMPFFHLMTIMVHSFLITMEWNSAVRLTIGIHSDDGVRISELMGMALLVVSLNTLRRVAIAMTNPFGDDETDYDLDHDLRRLWRQCEQTMARMPEDGHLVGRSQGLKADSNKSADCECTARVITARSIAPLCHMHVQRF